jgi:hypothetical protein
MNKTYNVRITSGTSPGPYNIYYNTINPLNVALLTGTETPATGLTITQMTTGVGVIIPDTSTSIILYNVDCENNITEIITSNPLVFSTFYLSDGVIDSDGHCGTNYQTGTPVYVEGTITTVPPLLNKTLYSDTSLTNEFNGGNLYYFVDTNNGASTTDLLVNLGQYPVISITSNGFVGTYETTNCSGGGGGAAGGTV